MLKEASLFDDEHVDDEPTRRTEDWDTEDDAEDVEERETADDELCEANVVELLPDTAEAGNGATPSPDDTQVATRFTGRHKTNAATPSLGQPARRGSRTRELGGGGRATGAGALDGGKRPRLGWKANDAVARVGERTTWDDSGRSVSQPV